MQCITQYYQSNSRKIQIDNVDIMNAFCKTMFLLIYSFINISDFTCLFLKFVSKNSKFS